ncbi:DUF5067 domain-containing protein [Loigolactobacillus coryniformis]|uniref:DUF5067 domain-containing protein n=1 Tax=Loigolactobacillus coryniformis TaxID=1610 RepID=UPI003F1E66BD
MKKSFVVGLLLLSSLSLTACGSQSANNKSATTATSTVKKAKNYKYFVTNNVFHENKGTVTLNKVVGGNIKNKRVFFLDETITNSSNKELSISSINSLEIDAYQKSADGSQEIKLDDQVTPSDLFDTTDDSSSQTDNYNLANSIVDRQNNKLLPGKTAHLLAEFGYTLDNTKNNVKLELNQTDTDTEVSVNPHKNSYTVKIADINNNQLNLAEY